MSEDHTREALDEIERRRRRKRLALIGAACDLAGAIRARYRDQFAADPQRPVAMLGVLARPQDFGLTAWVGSEPHPVDPSVVADIFSLAAIAAAEIVRDAQGSPADG